MKDVVRELLPHAPQMGLYVTPNLPSDKVQNALGDYASGINAEDVLALYDATLSGNAKDGVVFAVDRFVFQNSNLDSPQTIRYPDVVAVDAKRQWLGLGGRKVDLKVNRGRATFDLSIDFSRHPAAAEYVARFLDDAMLRDPALATAGPEAPDAGTDVKAVQQALDQLRSSGQLTEGDYTRLMQVLIG